MEQRLNRCWWRFARTNLNFHKYDNKQQGKKGLQGVQLRRRRSYGSPHRARMAKGQSSKKALFAKGIALGMYSPNKRALQGQSISQSNAFALTNLHE